MNRRKAKKRVKRRWGLPRWVGNCEPRRVDLACWIACVAIRAAVDEDFARAIRAAVDEDFARAIGCSEEGTP